MGFLNRITPEERDRLERVRKDPLWAEWVGTLNPRNTSYPSGLFALLGRLGLSPTEIIERAKSDNAGLAKKIKLVILSELNGKYAASTKKTMLAALKNFLALNSLQVPLLGLKIRHLQTLKPFLSWEDGERIIAKSDPTWHDAYLVMLHGALDDTRFIELNQDTVRIENVKKQLVDETRQWIRIPVSGRKSSPPFYIVLPRNIAKLLPVRGNDQQPISSRQGLIVHWRTALKRAGFGDRVRYGPHQLRSCWRSEATHRGLNPVIAEHQLGHTVDPLGYQRLCQEESWVIGEFAKAWQTQPLASKSEVDERLAKMQATIDEQARILEGIKTGFDKRAMEPYDGIMREPRARAKAFRDETERKSNGVV